jgi:hypothetical protein
MVVAPFDAKPSSSLGVSETCRRWHRGHPRQERFGCISPRRHTDGDLASGDPRFDAVSDGVVRDARSSRRDDVVADWQIWEQEGEILGRVPTGFRTAELATFQLPVGEAPWELRLARYLWRCRLVEWRATVSVV